MWDKETISAETVIILRPSSDLSKAEKNVNRWLRKLAKPIRVGKVLSL